MLKFELKGLPLRRKLEATASIEDEAAVLKRSRPSNLVIPVAAPSTIFVSNQKLAPNNTDEGEITRLAEKELLAGIRETTSADSQLVIPTINNDVGPSVQGKRAPLLLANIPTEVLQTKDEEAKFKVDLSLRAADVDVTSDSYQAVPIECFGAALLRGMGWQGPSDEELAKGKRELKEELVQPREQRLGLGATAKPPDAKSHKTGAPEKRDEWAKKAEERLKNQALQVGDIVWLRCVEYVGLRARVDAVQGVAGLSRIRVSLEDQGTRVEVKRADAVKLSEEELAVQPFTAGVAAVEPQVAATQYFGLKDKQEPAVAVVVKTSAAAPAVGSGGGGESAGGGGGGGEAKSELLRYWLRPGIRVRVVSKSLLEGSLYLKKATVLEVLDRGDKGILRVDGGGRVEGVRTKHLETILPAVGEMGMLVDGKLRGQLVRLLEKHRESNSVSVQLLEELTEIYRVSMDALAAMDASFES